jgi:hypothetical protein
MVVVSWVVVLVDSYFQGRELPLLLAEQSLPDIPLWILFVPAVLVPLVIACLTFWRRENVMEDIPKVTDWIDRVVFEGAYAYFMNRLYPVHASIVSAIIVGGVTCWVTMQMKVHATWVLWSHVFSLGCLVFVISMLVAVRYSRRYPPELK